MQLEPKDQVFWSDLVGDEGEVLVMSDRGYAKRVLMVDFDYQNRNGKGQRTFTFNRNGSNGSCVAAVRYVREPLRLQACQRSGTRTPIFTDDVLIEERASKGKMYVMALMDDIVTGFLDAAAEQGG
jgi:DNA gyrase/topoisomerase IV subunit A